jgi:predicted DNA-binding protein (MmcQ/YjbR family)
MNIEEFREYCLSKKGVTEGFPFDDVTLVLKVGGKMFALVSLDGLPTANLKCDPVRAIELREIFSSIIQGYHMSKKHWNTLQLDGALTDTLVCELIDHSYDLVYNSLTVRMKNEIE